MCRQLHQMLPCMKSQLVVIDKFPNTSKDFSNYLSPLLKLNSCISFPPSFFFQGYVRACFCDSAGASRKICFRERARERDRGTERERREEIKRERKRERKCMLDWSAGHTNRQHPFISSWSTNGQDFIISREAVSRTYFESLLYSSSIPLH